MSAPKKPRREKIPNYAGKIIKSRDNLNDRLDINRYNPFYPLFTPNEFEMSIKIPKEVLIMILQHVISSSEDSLQTMFNLSQACEQWRQVVIDTPQLWEKIALKKLAGHEKQFPLPLFEYILENVNERLFIFVRHLDFSQWNFKNVVDIVDFLNKYTVDGQEFESLSISGCTNVTSSLLLSIFERPKNLSNIKSLEMSRLTQGLHNCNNLLTTSVMKTIMEAIGNTLISFDLSENLLIPFSNCFATIMDHAHNIEVLDLSNVIDTGSSCPLVRLPVLQKSLPKLRIFRAANVMFSHAVDVPCSGFPNLEELSIPLQMVYCRSSGHQHETVLYLTHNAKKLKLLDIRWSQNIYSNCLNLCLSPSIRHLFLSHCSKMEQLNPIYVRPFEVYGKYLEELDVGWNRSYGSMDLLFGALLKSAGNGELRLKKLDLQGASFKLSSFKKFLNKCKSLEMVNLESCRNVPRGLKRYYKNREELELLIHKLNTGSYVKEEYLL